MWGWGEEKGRSLRLAQSLTFLFTFGWAPFSSVQDTLSSLDHPAWKDGFPLRGTQNLIYSHTEMMTKPFRAPSTGYDGWSTAQGRLRGPDCDSSFIQFPKPHLQESFLLSWRKAALSVERKSKKELKETVDVKSWHQVSTQYMLCIITITTTVNIIIIIHDTLSDRSEFKLCILGQTTNTQSFRGWTFKSSTSKVQDTLELPSYSRYAEWNRDCDMHCCLTEEEQSGGQLAWQGQLRPSCELIDSFRSCLD